MHEFGWARRRLRPARRRQPGRPHHRMRLPGHRRPAHRLGGRAGLGAHRLPGHRVPRRRQLHRHQAGGHGRAGEHRRRVAEQMLYEIGDPRRYLLPDVMLRFHAGDAASRSASTGCEVSGARGLPPAPQLQGQRRPTLDGFRCTAQLTIVGIDAAAQGARAPARRSSSARASCSRRRAWPATAARASRCWARKPAIRPACGHAPRCARRCCALAVMHPHKAALELFAREIAPAGTSWSPGTTGAGGRPSPRR